MYSCGSLSLCRDGSDGPAALVEAAPPAVAGL
jgi:hypothetical protein